MLSLKLTVIGWIFVITSMLAGIAGCFAMRYTLWPGVHDDGVAYTTRIINRAGGLGNNFSVYTHALMRYNNSTTVRGHGQLYHGIMSRIIRNATYKQLLKTMYDLNLITFILSFVLFSITIYRKIKGLFIKNSKVIASVLSVPFAYAIAAVMLYLQGRPEHGIPLLLVISHLFRHAIRSGKVIACADGIEIGLVAAISQ